MANQENAFIKNEADSWFERNSKENSYLLKAADENHIAINALSKSGFKNDQKLNFLDLGGSTGWISAGLKNKFPDWNANVLELSESAINFGSKNFQGLTFQKGSVCQKEGFGTEKYDLVMILGVFCWIDRSLLSQAVRNIDQAIKECGYLVIAEFDSPSFKKNPYAYLEGCYTYKQNYSKIFESLGIYRIASKLVNQVGSRYDNGDFFDNVWGVTILEKSYKNYYISKS